MLSLPQPPATATSSTPPIISMQEDRHTLEKLLLHCYPGFGTSLDCLDDIKVVLAAATKYDMQAVLKHIRKWMVISPLFQANLLAFYAIFCLQGWEAEARLAALNLLENKEFWLGSNHYVPELENISAGSYYRLTIYHARCGAAARDTMQNLEWLDERLMPNESMVSHLSGYHDRRGCAIVKFRIGARTCDSCPKWFETYLRAVGEELVCRPSAATVAHSELFDKAVLEGSSCDGCRSHLIPKMPELRNLFAAQVSEVVSKVQLDFVPPTQKAVTE
ncbi:hypothetical protein BJ138DRAFT_808098 [Hygrophoropsis aurantiaca]|uniref:Uncharacterized protein n=1 Tax=Hygrophoropsis aurantiaca TaxID=72124 RepID=A0ACB8AI95_9AGAM|nr:hypothetical protein BJ138DRAFT_808098 [Hygrophoropsis aurantiaca]